ncbi:MAG: SpoIID/LytB domain-containing protein [Desulfobacterales bacterium]|nr:SpoIID/LytB domain-containing protein [Desulfobacterales bacterium]
MNLKHNGAVHALRYILISAAFCFLHPVVFVHAAYDDTGGFSLAADFLNKGMYLEALGTYQEISNYSKNDNNRARALLFMGTTFGLYLDQPNAAITQFQTVMNRYPRSQSAPDALFNTGMVLYETGRFKDAYQIFLRYLQQYPQGIRRQSAEVWADSSRSLMAETPPQIQPWERMIISDSVIRVLIQEKATRLAIESAAPITLSASFSGKIVFNGMGPVTIERYGNALAINGRMLEKTALLANSARPIGVNGRKFRGAVEITSEADGLRAVNHVNIEHYLYGVVPKEMPHKWPKAALMAQAVAARTYALYIKQKSGEKPYDVLATTASQVYGGYDAEKTETNRAADETAGQVLSYDNRLIIAYFHSNSGGHTEDAKNVWSADIPYLKGIPDPYSNQAPNVSWEISLTYRAITERLNRFGLNIGRIQALSHDGRTASGRILRIRVADQSETSEIASNNFRIKMDATQIKSTLFDIVPQANGLTFRGRGYGHGVGMSQWGARQMAATGMKYQDILKYYYQGVRLVSVTYLN